jgi:DNA-directed RNA polymerase subunit RPC12/RpoP
MPTVGACGRCGYELDYSELPRGSGLIRCPDCNKILGDKCGS